MGVIRKGKVTIQNLPFQQDIANMAGTSRETVSRVLKILENKNIILIAPHFSSTSYPNYALLEMATSSGKILTDQSKYLTDSISAFFTFFKS